MRIIIRNSNPTIWNREQIPEKINEQLIVEDYVVHKDTQTIVAAASPRDNMAPLRVPAGMYFTMGDNRDYSYDSRFWGFVAEEKISGRAAKIYWSWDSKNTEVRWQRIGQTID